MLITEVCEREGCKGNRFYISTDGNVVSVKCSDCGEEYEYSNKENIIVTPCCSKCDSELFKVFREKESDKVYFSCAKCGSIPRIVYVDEEGHQVSYEQLRVINIEKKLDELAKRIGELEEGFSELSYGTSSVSNTLEYVYNWVSDIKAKTDKI
jgi:hypothetical protein